MRSQALNQNPLS